MYTKHEQKKLREESSLFGRRTVYGCLWGGVGGRGRAGRWVIGQRKWEKCPGFYPFSCHSPQTNQVLKLWAPNSSYGQASTLRGGIFSNHSNCGKYLGVGRMRRALGVIEGEIPVFFFSFLWSLFSLLPLSSWAIQLSEGHSKANRLTPSNHPQLYSQRIRKRGGGEPYESVSGRFIKKGTREMNPISCIWTPGLTLKLWYVGLTLNKGLEN